MAYEMQLLLLVHHLHDATALDSSRDLTASPATASPSMSDASRWKATVFVGGLPSVATTANIRDAFIPFGDIVDVQIPKPDSRSSTDTHRGFAYVEYEDSADAQEAIDNMDRSEFFGRILKVSPAKAPKSATEGLGSKKAVWEQVSRTSCCTHLRATDDTLRRTGY